MAKKKFPPVTEQDLKEIFARLFRDATSMSPRLTDYALMTNTPRAYPLTRANVNKYFIPFNWR